MISSYVRIELLKGRRVRERTSEKENKTPRGYILREQIVHLLQRQLFRLGQEGPEEHRVREVANYKHEIVLPPHGLHRNTRHLSNHSVKCERGHRRKGNTLCSCPRVKYLGWDDPRQRTTGGREGEIVAPCHDDKAPSLRGAAFAGWVDGEQRGGDDECDHVEEITPDERPTPAKLIDEGDAEGLSDEGNDGVDRLVF